MEQLINHIVRNGGDKERLEIKVFGGGAMMKLLAIGEENIRFVRAYLRTENLQVVAEDLGGDHARRVIYLPRSGKVKIRKIKGLSAGRVVQEEQMYKKSLDSKPVEGDIELF